jgi:outer membrane protein TolC
MNGPRLPVQFTWRWTAALLLSWTGLLPAAGPAVAAEPAAGQEPSASATSETAPTLGLAECLQMALHDHPRIAAARASLASAEDASQALESLSIPECLAPDLPIRRRQAALGVTAAAAGVEHAQVEVVYDVTRTYFTVLFAREQEQVARGVTERLSAIREVARQMLKAGARDVSDSDVNRTTVYLRLAETKRLEASQGVKRALAALREALGRGPEFHFNVAEGRLPEPAVQPNQDETLAAALARRPGLIQATIFAELTCLEVDAQATTSHVRLETFAAGGDIHSRAIPHGTRGTEYRPGGIDPEMPTLLAGSRAERMHRARSLHARAVAVVGQTRNLITLEVADAFLRWQLAAQQAAKAREAADAGDSLADSLNKDFITNQRVKIEDVVNARVLASQARGQYNQFLNDEILALADLERATAGGFHAGLVEALAPKKEETRQEDRKGK